MTKEAGLINEVRVRVVKTTRATSRVPSAEAKAIFAGHRARWGLLAAQSVNRNR